MKQSRTLTFTGGKEMRPVNKNATPEAVGLLEFLYDNAGKRLITGQHTQTVPMEEIDYIFEKTGKKPALRGFELLGYSPNINYDPELSSEECLTEVRENQGTVETALKWAKEEKGILTFSFHWFSPIGGADKSFYAEHTDFDAEKVLVEGSPERQSFFHDLDVIADILRRFQEENIPILWRPFHESDGQWFWWGARGPAVAKELYKLMFDHYVHELGLNNLLWVWNCRLKEGYPGDDYVDVVSVDIYLEKYAPTDYKAEYEELIRGTSTEKVAALGEVGYLPDMPMWEKSHVPWAYYMSWSKEWIIGERVNSAEKLREIYDSPQAITAEDLPMFHVKH